MTADSARAALVGTRFTDLRWFDEVESTQDVAAALARDGAQDGTVVVADHQRAGRGRQGREWEAPPGSSLLMSMILRPSWPPEAAPACTLAVAVAAVRSCAEVAGVELGLKWPNDLVTTSADGQPDRKVGGILAERIDGAVVVGIGVNVAWPSPVGAGRATLDDLAPGLRTGRLSLPVSLLRHLDGVLELTPDQVVWAAVGHSVTLGRRVRVDLPDGQLVGTAVRMTATGQLVVEDAEANQQHTVAAGDVVHLRPE